ncbi:MAG: hypothetical protein PUH18_06265 [Coriobacteriaceae bacterium]|nr:hypothetical protein [Coriobacteriaceae bacterium]
MTAGIVLTEAFEGVFMGRGQQAAVLVGALVLLAVPGLGGTYGGCSRGTSATGGADAGQFERVQDVERLLQGTWSGDSGDLTFLGENLTCTASGVLPDALYDGGFSGSYELARVSAFDDPDAAAPGYTGELKVGGQSVAFTYAPGGGRGPATLTVGEQDGSELVFIQQ